MPRPCCCFEYAGQPGDKQVAARQAKYSLSAWHFIAAKVRKDVWGGRRQTLLVVLHYPSLLLTYLSTCLPSCPYLPSFIFLPAFLHLFTYLSTCLLLACLLANLTVYLPTCRLIDLPTYTLVIITQQTS